MIELYKKKLTNTYSCRDFFVDATLLFCGKDLSVVMNKPELDIRKDFKLTREPVEPCMVMMHGKQPADPHMGLYIDGGVIHITTSGVVHHPLEIATYGYSSVRFYQWN